MEEFGPEGLKRVVDALLSLTENVHRRGEMTTIRSIETAIKTITNLASTVQAIRNRPEPQHIADHRDPEWSKEREARARAELEQMRKEILGDAAEEARAGSHTSK